MLKKISIFAPILIKTIMKKNYRVLIKYLFLLLLTVFCVMVAYYLRYPSPASGANKHTNSVEKSPHNKYDTLHFCVVNGNLACLKLLLKEQPDSNYKNTAFLWSARFGQLNLLQYLLEQGADINDRDEAENTALILSTYNNHLDCVAYLVQKGADLTLKGLENKTALEWAEEMCHDDVAYYLSQCDT